MDLTALRRWWPLAAVLGLLLVTAAAATRSTPQLRRFDPDGPPPATTAPPPLLPTGPPPSAPPESPAPVEAAQDLPAGADRLVLVLVAVAAAATALLVGVALLREWRRRRAARGGRWAPGPPVTAGPDGADAIVAVLDAGLSDLSDADRDPRRAVIACWVRLEQAAAAAGTRRLPGDSPTDLVERLLAEQRVDARALAALAALYREARYATHTVDDRMRAGARAALQRLRADLGAEVRG